MKKCTLAPRHQWTWTKNTTSGQVGGRGISLSLRGIYRCKCGEQKVGTPNHDANQPNPLNDLVAGLAGKAAP